MESFITKDGKKLRRGYTSGSCCAAAAKTAAVLLLSGEALKTIHLTTPSGIELDLPVQDLTLQGGTASCGIIKDSGDDPDVTNGITFFASVEKIPEPGVIRIEGGEGIGRVTKPGLDQPVGEAAVNSTPRRMITAALREVCEETGYSGGLCVTLSVPGGAEVAKKTFNPRLGIVGGLSILGTTGIIDPMSDDAVIETLRAEMSQRKAEGKTVLLLTPGNFGADFIRDELGLDPAKAVTVSNYIGDALYAAEEFGFEGVLLVGHIGKLVKLAAGMFNTHSRYGDGRKEIFAAHAAACGAPAETVRAILSGAVVDEMLSQLEAVRLRDAVMQAILGQIDEQLAHRLSGRLRAAVITFSKVYGLLGETAGSEELLTRVRAEYGKEE